MINSILIKNFKSYKEAEIHLSPLTLMIGANASGKSNAVEALSLLSWLAKCFRTALRNIVFLDPNPLVMRKYAYVLKIL